MNPAPSLTRLADRIKLDLPIPISEIVSAGYLSRSTLLRMRISGLPSTRIGHRVLFKFSDLEKWGQPLQPGDANKFAPEECRHDIPDQTSEQPREMDAAEKP